MGKCEVVDRLKKSAIEEFISNMLKDGKTPEEIADFCHLDLKKVKEVLFVKLPASYFSLFSQIKRRYSINDSDASCVRLFYPVPSVIIIMSV